jgi:outer membrane protein OmpA-like peptidoglycan-associated protein/tetratricopeptide (TPR) repeat protein
MFWIRPSFIFLLALIICLKVSAQDNCAPPDDSKAVDLYQKGTDKKKYQKEQRIAFLKQALELEPDYVDANFAYAEEIIKTAILNQSSFSPAAEYFLTVIKQCPKYHSDPYYYVGFNYYEDEKYADAVTYLQKFLDFKSDDEKKFSKDYDNFLYEAKKMIKYAKFYRDIFKNTVPFDPYPVMDICTNRDEYLAIISPDNQHAYFTRKMPYTAGSMDQVYAAEESTKEFFMESNRQANGTFSAGTPLPPPFNRGSNEGGPSISINNKNLYFTICKDEGGPQLNCDLYYSNFEYGEWTEIQNMGAQVNDPSAWDSQPSISADGCTLYFASNRAGGMGKADLYKTVKDPKTGEWSVPINLGAPINTPGNEKSPFIHSDSHTLYFSSDGHMGVGGYDIFYSRADSNGGWQEPTNIGYPINSTGDDLGFFVSTDGKTGFFCSNDPNRTKGRGQGGWDVFQFALYSAARPEMVAVRIGKIEVPDGDPSGVSITVTDAKTHKKSAAMYDTVTGEYAIITSAKNPSVISVNKKGYSFTSGLITAQDTFTGKPQSIDLTIKPIAVNSSYALNNIYYQTNSAQLQPISIEVIKEFVKFLKANPGLKIKIAGYTDNIGNQSDNMALSKDRAFTVMQTIEQEGITADRLTFQGYGPAKPIASNDTEEGRQRNRRTEFIILEK